LDKPTTPAVSHLAGEAAAASPDELPLLKGTAARVADLSGDSRSSVKTLAAAVMGDPALSLRLLHKANAVPHRHFRNEVSTLEDAVRMLGTQALIRMATDAPVADERLDAASLPRYRRSAGQALLAARLATDWAESRHDMSPPEVALAALMYNLGELFLLAHGDRRIDRYLELVGDSHVLPHEAEYVSLGESLEELGLVLARHWKLPEMVRESMRARNAQHLRTLGVMLSAQIARDALSGWRHPMLTADLRLVGAFLDEPAKRVVERINDVVGSFNGDAAYYGLEPLQALALDEQGRCIAQDEAWRAHFCLAPRADDFAACLKALRGGAADKTQVLKALVRGLHHGLGLNRVAFAALSAQREYLVGEHLQGTDFEPEFNRFHLPLAEAGLFARLMDKPAAFWLKADNQAKAWPQVPERVRELVGVRSFFAMSLFVGDKPLGLVYADRRSSECELDARSYEAFRLLVRMAGQRIEQLL